MKQEYRNIEDIIRLLNVAIEICFVNRNSQTSKYFTENGQFLKDLVLRAYFRSILSEAISPQFPIFLAPGKRTR